MGYSEDLSIASEEWRLNAVMTLTEPVQLEHFHESGAPVKEIVRVSHDRYPDSLLFGAPNIAAMMLDQAHRLWLKGRDFYGAFGAPRNGVRQPPGIESEVFDLLEARMASVVFAFTAIESFANQHIAGAYLNTKYEYVGKRRSGIHEVWSLERLERTMQIDEKLASVLPDIYKIKSPKGRAAWNHFQRLKRLRDRIVHCKVKDLIQPNPRGDSLWRQITEPAFRDPANDAYDLIDYTCSQLPDPPRWAAKYPHRPRPNA